MMIFNCTGFKGKWSKWSQWSECSNYVQKRTRACHTQSCSGEKVEKKACNEKEKGKGNIVIDQDVVAAQDQEGIISSSGLDFLIAITFSHLIPLNPRQPIAFFGCHLLYLINCLNKNLKIFFKVKGRYLQFSKMQILILSSLWFFENDNSTIFRYSTHVLQCALHCYTVSLHTNVHILYYTVLSMLYQIVVGPLFQNFTI